MCVSSYDWVQYIRSAADMIHLQFKLHVKSVIYLDSIHSSLFALIFICLCSVSWTQTEPGFHMGSHTNISVMFHHTMLGWQDAGRVLTGWPPRIGWAWANLFSGLATWSHQQDLTQINICNRSFVCCVLSALSAWIWKHNMFNFHDIWFGMFT
jgi:hypothetical protein